MLRRERKRRKGRGREVKRKEGRKRERACENVYIFKTTRTKKYLSLRLFPHCTLSLSSSSPSSSSSSSSSEDDNTPISFKLSSRSVLTVPIVGVFFSSLVFSFSFDSLTMASKPPTREGSRARRDVYDDGFVGFLENVDLSLLLLLLLSLCEQQQSDGGSGGKSWRCRWMWTGTRGLWTRTGIRS